MCNLMNLSGFFFKILSSGSEAIIWPIVLFDLVSAIDDMTALSMAFFMV